MKTLIENIQDYPALKKLAAVLWKQDNSYHGAAVMIGAGFSRCAATSGDITKKLPLWGDLSNAIASDMETGINSDPLRLAEEYCAYFGRQSLYDLVKKHVNDAAWQPSKMHSTLLELPWSEVLTTNWDTLLERSAVNVHQPVYSVVIKQEDLSNARSPRIVKLHGTINVTEELTFTQEDYRRYPESKAAFVNFARQVFIENELCLLGFSGDDPNFLQWAGWVRDQLSTNARRIYLVGALKLNAAKRKYLESINVAPIDLADLVIAYDDQDTKHRLATEIFIETLRKLKPKQPWEWKLSQASEYSTSSEDIDKGYSDPQVGADIYKKRLSHFSSVRSAYPGWIVCPSSYRWELQSQFTTPFFTSKVFGQLDTESKSKLLYELSWHHSITHEAIPSWLAQEMYEVCSSGRITLSKREKLEIVLALLRNSRWIETPINGKIKDLATSMTESDSAHWEEAKNELNYQCALIALKSFDYQKLEELAESICARSSEWRLKKASLFSEIGRFKEGEALVSEAYHELRLQFRNDPNSVYILSRLAWAHWMLRAITRIHSADELDALPVSHQDFKCDPWAQLENVQKKISKMLEQQKKNQGIEPLFEPGSYRDNSQARTFSNEVHPLLVLEGIASKVGIPLRWNNINLLVDEASKLAELTQLDPKDKFALAIRAASTETSDVLKKTFSRSRMAELSQDDANYLLERSTQAFGYWANKWNEGKGDERNYAIDRLRVFGEVLARASVRATVQEAKAIFEQASELCKNPKFQHPWLFDTLNHLIQYSHNSIPTALHHELLFTALSIPLQSELDANAFGSWPNPVVANPGDRANNPALDRRIDEIIDRIHPLGDASVYALSRIRPLFEKDFLTKAECEKIAEKIWGIEPDYSTLPETGLLNHVLLNYPSKNPKSVREQIRKYLFDATGIHIFERLRLRDIVAAAQNGVSTELPNNEQALKYFNEFVEWRAPVTEDDPYGLSFFRKTEAPLVGLIGRALSHSVVPALASEEFTEENFKNLLRFHMAGQAAETLIALAHFAAREDCFADRVEKLIGQGFQERESSRVAFSSFALLKWREIVACPATTRLTQRLIYVMGSSRITGLSSLLWTADQMARKGILSVDETEAISEVVPVIFDNTAYGLLPDSSKEAISASLVRAECVRLAGSLLSGSPDEYPELVRILDEAKSDSLPEVRFALDADLKY